MMPSGFSTKSMCLFLVRLANLFTQGISVFNTVSRLKLLFNALLIERRGRCFNIVLRGSFRDIGLKYKMSGLSVSKIWKMSFVKHETEN